MVITTLMHTYIHNSTVRNVQITKSLDRYGPKKKNTHKVNISIFTPSKDVKSVPYLYTH